MKNNRVMLLYPEWTGGYDKDIRHFAKRKSETPPLGLAYLAAYAEDRGFEARIIDGQVDELNLETMVENALSFNPGIVGVGSTTPFHHLSEEAARRVKNALGKDVITVIGGPHITVTGCDPDSFPKDAFDYGFIGQADTSWGHFLESYDLGKPLEETKGVVFWRDGKIIDNTPAPQVDPSKIPFPARHLLPMEKYFIATPRGTLNFTSIKTVRGCPFKCTFCSTDIWGYKLRRTDPKPAVDEIEKVINEHGIRHFYFMDDTLTANKAHITTVCDEIIKRKLDITFEGGTRANLIYNAAGVQKGKPLDEGLVAKMREAGLIKMTFGLEAVDPNIRKIMRKEVPVIAHEIANRLSNKYGIEARNSAMVGMPGETPDTLRQTCKYIRLSKDLKLATFTVAVPYPGTELAKQAERGEYGMKIMDSDYKKYQRYNSAIMQCGDLSPADLVRMQNDAILSIWAAPHRWLPSLKRHGFKGILKTLKRIPKAYKDGFQREPFLNHYKEPQQLLPRQWISMFKDHGLKSIPLTFRHIKQAIINGTPDYLFNFQLGIKRGENLAFDEAGELVSDSTYVPDRKINQPKDIVQPSPDSTEKSPFIKSEYSSSLNTPQDLVTLKVQAPSSNNFPPFKGKPFLTSNGKTMYVNYLEGDFGQAALNAFNKRIQDFDRNPIVDVLHFKNNYVVGEGPFPNILMNYVLQQYGVHTASASELERVLEQGVLDLRGTFQYPSFAIRSDEDPTNPFVNGNLIEQISKIESPSYPYMINSRELFLTPDNRAKDGIAINLSPNAVLLYSPQLSYDNDQKTFKNTDEYGRPIFNGSGDRTFHALEWGLSPYCLDKDNDYDSEGGSLRGAASQGRMVVVSENSA